MASRIADHLFRKVVQISDAGIDLESINAFSPRLQSALQLRPIPDLLFAVIPVVIAWIRFR